MKSRSASVESLADASADAAALESFRTYVRLRTDHPNPTEGYRAAMQLLRRYADALDLQFHELELEEGHPLAVLTWTGRDPSLPSVILNSHTDVVPAETDKWTREPFGAELHGDKIYGCVIILPQHPPTIMYTPVRIFPISSRRGTQDMKSVGIQYLEALGRLRLADWAPERTLHLLYVPDEEVGGARGIKLLLAHSLMGELRPGLVLDEGLPSPDGKVCALTTRDLDDCGCESTPLSTLSRIKHSSSSPTPRSSLCTTGSAKSGGCACAPAALLAMGLVSSLAPPSRSWSTSSTGSSPSAPSRRQSFRPRAGAAASSWATLRL